MPNPEPAKYRVVGYRFDTTPADERSEYFKRFTHAMEYYALLREDEDLERVVVYEMSWRPVHDSAEVRPPQQMNIIDPQDLIS